MTQTRQFRLAMFLFFGSGCCALAYETVWVRQLTLSFGISVYAVSAVLAAYMFGLCVGAYTVGRMSHRVRNPLRVFALFELAIVGYTFLLYFILADFTPMLYRMGYGLLPDQRAVLTITKFAGAFLVLAFPTALMGGTLPVLSVFLRDSKGEIGSGVGRLYGINTLGGAAGTALAGFWLLKDLGIFATTVVTLVFNLIICFTALYFSRNAKPATAAVAPAPAASAERPPGTALVSLVLLLSGYTALSYEVMWNRSLLFYIHNSTYVFSVILIVFLFGTSLGSLLYGLLPKRWTGMRTLGIVQIALAVFVWLSIPLTGRLPSILSGVTRALGTESWLAAISLIVTAVVTIVLVPTVLAGFTFPAATALLAGRREHVGEVTGRAYAVLTIGNILGPILTGFLLIEWIGLRNAFAVGIALNLIGGFALIAYRPGAHLLRYAGATVAVAATLGLFLTTVDRDIYRSYYESLMHKIVFYKEEVTDNVLVWEDERGDRGIFYSDGRGTAGTNTDLYNRLYGHVPMLLHPEPRSVLSICFGVGNTLSALAEYEPDKLVCVELSPGAIEAARYFPTNRDVLSTPNLRLHIDDGRNFLLRSEERFDVIQLEPPELHQAGVVNLYTREFYELARDRLEEGGIVCQWFSDFLPDYERKMVIRSFLDVFPEASLWSGGNITSLVLVGSPTPIRIRPEEFRANADLPLVREDLRRLGLSAVDVMAYHLMGAEGLSELTRGVPVITDDRTYVDFSTPRSVEAGFGVFSRPGAGPLWIYEDDPSGSAGTERTHDEIKLNNLRLFSPAESPEYFFDFSGTDPEAATFRRELEAAVTRHRNARGVYRHQLEAKRFVAEGKLAEATASYREALLLNPEDADVVYYIGVLLLLQDDLEGARIEFERALAINPGHNAARMQLQKLGR